MSLPRFSLPSQFVLSVCFSAAAARSPSGDFRRLKVWAGSREGSREGSTGVRREVSLGLARVLEWVVLRGFPEGLRDSPKSF